MVPRFLGRSQILVLMMISWRQNNTMPFDSSPRQFHFHSNNSVLSATPYSAFFFFFKQEAKKKYWRSLACLTSVKHLFNLCSWQDVYKLIHCITHLRKWFLNYWQWFPLLAVHQLCARKAWMGSWKRQFGDLVCSEMWHLPGLELLVSSLRITILTLLVI